ncbi:hypothetical protein [Lacrimispora sp. JR3]|uniref:hypothetical protein n=1 Tax=Lacrimispora sinapis TaxID=3111456 RepID=UPI00374A460A
MRQRDTSRIKTRSRSRRRRESRGHERFMGFLTFVFILILFVSVTTGGVYGYRYWEGSKPSGQPLESSREVVPETMQEQNQDS